MTVVTRQGTYAWNMASGSATEIWVFLDQQRIPSDDVEIYWDSVWNKLIAIYRQGKSGVVQG